MASGDCFYWLGVLVALVHLDNLGSVFLYEGEELAYSFLLWDILEYAFFAFVEAYFATARTHITVVCVCHFTRTIDNTPHDADLESLQVSGGCFHFGNGLL